VTLLSDVAATDACSANDWACRATRDCVNGIAHFNSFGQGIPSFVFSKQLPTYTGVDSGPEPRLVWDVGEGEE
jgi:hypothetical protein